jgi:predicted MPP superfamily phosphohydrolase
VSAAYIAFIAYALVVACAFTRRLAYGLLVMLELSFPILVGNALRGWWEWFDPLILYLQCAICLHVAYLIVRPSLRSKAFRALVSIPGLWFSASSFLALPWGLAAALGYEPVLVWLPFVLCVLGVVQTLVTRREVVDIRLDGAVVDGLRRHPVALDRRGRSPGAGRPIRIVQITDPHLGPFMSVARLRSICANAVGEDPDLVLITGDLMTLESENADVVAAALDPLKLLPGRVFACHGNHDHQARAVVERAFARLGIRLLIDEAIVVRTPGGAVQIVGADFVLRERAEHLQALAQRFPRVAGALRLWLLHDPGAFRHMPEGEGDLVLSGHTHGGQIGLVSLGMPWTVVALLFSIPDHGLWARGRDRLYVHRSQGHYGFPIRLGVPAEESVLRVWPTLSGAA